MIYNLCEIGLDEETLRSYRMREMAEFDYNSGIKKAEDEKSTEIARNALRMNMPVDDIMKLTGLSRQQIGDIKI